MCGSLRLSAMANKPAIRIKTSGSVSERTLPEGVALDEEGSPIQGICILNGFARQESISDWTSKGWEEGILPAEGFTEQKEDFDIPVGCGVKIVYLSKETGTFINITTREATDTPTGRGGQTEEDIHSRYPKIVDLPDH